MVSTKIEYDQVELTEEEIADALRQAREKKYYKIKEQEYKEKVYAQANWSVPNARTLLEGLKRTTSKSGKPYEVNDNNRDVISILCLYFSNNPKLTELYPHISPDKGICLAGPAGVGKTHLMNYFARNPKQSYKLATCKDIAEKFRTNWEYEGVGTIDYYASKHTSSHPQPFNQEFSGMCFGDLGYEDDKNNYGNKMNVMDEIFFKRYESGLPLNFTHFTTNLGTKDEIVNRYGVRFYDRLRETCNWIVLKGESFRG